MNSESTIESQKSDGIEDDIYSGDNEDIRADSIFYLVDATCVCVFKIRLINDYVFNTVKFEWISESTCVKNPYDMCAK